MVHDFLSVYCQLAWSFTVKELWMSCHNSAVKDTKKEKKESFGGGNENDSPFQCMKPLSWVGFLILHISSHMLSSSNIFV